MKWSWRIGTVAGIGVYIHATFLLILGWVVLSHWIQGHTAAATAGGVLFTLALFGCVLLHEFGHALMAKKYGIRTRDITYITGGAVCGKWWRGDWFGTQEGFGVVTLRGNKVEWDYQGYGWTARRPEGE